MWVRGDASAEIQALTLDVQIYMQQGGTHHRSHDGIRPGLAISILLDEAERWNSGAQVEGTLTPHARSGGWASSIRVAYLGDILT